MIRTVLLVIALLAANLANAETPGQRRALELARATLAGVQSADAALQEAIARKDERMLRERVTIPLKQLFSRWQSAPGATDKDKFTHDGCINAVNELTKIRDTYVFRDPLTKDPESRRAYLRELYREELEQCKDSIRHGRE